MKPILEIQNIGKRYRIQHMAGGYLSLRERMVKALKFERSNVEDFWALKDISFEVNAGESIGIIGRNGAGKSTLLKILSKITPPTTGRIVSRGRIASLLEVGTGFHPELTGRENISFNGSLLGMKRKEILAKFDEIVEFSGVEHFLDTPLKHYSSGMQLRLAFAVAAFLEPEILIIDEVLAVGDVEFQKKCMGKMEDVSKSGRTILFVSHNLGAVSTLCKNSILLHNGKIEFFGNSKGTINKYLSGDDATSNNGLIHLESHKGKKYPKKGIVEARLIRNGQLGDVFYSMDKFLVELDFIDDKPIHDVVFGLVIKDSDQRPLIGINNWDLGIKLNKKPLTKGTLIFEIQHLPLYGDATYYIDLYFGDGGNNYDTIINAINFKIQPVDVFSNGKILNTKLNSVFPGEVNIRIND
jgi:lipopolysaccharide transport system ATP-binding protein